jgi:hypothetical protein
MGVLASSSHCYIFCNIFLFSCILFYFILFYLREKKCELVNNPKMGYDSCPPLYNAYGAKILCSKYCKDKQNWSSEIGLLDIWLT